MLYKKYVNYNLWDLHSLDFNTEKTSLGGFELASASAPSTAIINTYNLGI